MTEVEVPTKTKKRVGKRPFVIALSALSVVIVGLIVAILAVVFVPKEEGGGNDGLVVIVDPDEELVEEIKAELGPMTTEEAELYLTDRIEEYGDNQKVAFELMLSKAYLQIEANESNCALNTLNGINRDGLSKEQLMNYYSAMRETYDALGDEAKSLEYQKLYFEVYLEVFDGGGGGE